MTPEEKLCPKCRCPVHEPKRTDPRFTPICSECCLKEKSLKNVVIVYRKG